MFKRLFGIIMVVGLVAACGSDDKPAPPEVEDMAQDTNEPDAAEDVSVDVQNDVAPDQSIEDMSKPVVWVSGEEDSRSDCKSTCINAGLTCEEGPVLTAVAALRAKYEGGTEILDDCETRPPQTTNDFSGNPVELESYQCRCV